jgi:uncharacterized membrane protein YdbT with pleckstrin-like domain
VPILGLGLLLLLSWYINARFETLRTNGDRVVYECGIFSKDRVELQISMIRSVRIAQTLSQRILGAGDVYITSSGSSPEIIALGMPYARRIRELLSSPADEAGLPRS